MSAFWVGFNKRAEDKTDWGTTATEIGGLGTLAVPSIQHLRGKHMPEGRGHKYELAGLGILAAPSVYKAGKHLLNRMSGAPKPQGEVSV